MQEELTRTYKDCKNIGDVYRILNGYANTNNKKAINTFVQDWIKDCSEDIVKSNLRYIWGNGLSNKFCQMFNLNNLKTELTFIEKALEIIKGVRR